MIFLGAYIAVAIVVAVMWARECYGRPGERRPQGQIQPGNWRSAVPTGILWGAMWPLLVLGALIAAAADWVARGKKCP